MNNLELLKAKAIEMKKIQENVDIEFKQLLKEQDNYIGFDPVWKKNDIFSKRVPYCPNCGGQLKMQSINILRTDVDYEGDAIFSCSCGYKYAHKDMRGND